MKILSVIAIVVFLASCDNEKACVHSDEYKDLDFKITALENTYKEIKKQCEYIEPSDENKT